MVQDGSRLPVKEKERRPHLDEWAAAEEKTTGVLRGSGGVRVECNVKKGHRAVRLSLGGVGVGAGGRGVGVGMGG
jgi:hypothetical protein